MLIVSRFPGHGFSRMFTRHLQAQLKDAPDFMTPNPKPPTAAKTNDLPVTVRFSFVLGMKGPSIAVDAEDQRIVTGSLL